jgi:hypothetical protein
MIRFNNLGYCPFRDNILVEEFDFFDFRAFRYEIYVVSKGTKTIRLIDYFTHIMSLKGLWPYAEL